MLTTYTAQFFICFLSLPNLEYIISYQAVRDITTVESILYSLAIYVYEYSVLHGQRLQLVYMFPCGFSLISWI